MSIQRMFRFISFYVLGLSVVIGLGCSGGSSGTSSGGTYTGVPEDQIIAAVLAGDAGAVKTLLTGDPGLANAWDENSYKSVLHYAVERESGAIVEMLLAKGADPLAQDNNGNSPLDLAREARSPDAILDPLREAMKKGSAPAAPK